MLSYTAAQIAQILHTESSALPHPQAMINDLSYNTKTIFDPAHTLFIALKGTLDGHAFVQEALRLGIKNIVISQDLNIPAGINVFKVNDTLAALQKIASHHRAQFTYPVISITGSNGKTTVKEWLSFLLHDDTRLVKSPRSYNSQIGVPVSVLKMQHDHELGIFEAGVSKRGEMEKLENILHPDIGLLTNIGSAHDEGFSSREEKLNEKLQLFKHAKKLVYCSDENWIEQAVTAFVKDHPRIKPVSWSTTDKTADYVIQQQKNNAGQTTITIDGISLLLTHDDLASVQNATHCAVLLCVLGKDLSQFKDLFSQLPALEMRMQLIHGKNCDIINDSYSADLESLQIALDYLYTQNQEEKKALILSDLLQTGIPEEQLYPQLFHMLEKRSLHLLIGIGEAMIRYAGSYRGNARFYRDTEAFMQDLHADDLAHYVVLVKGARKFRFEKIIERLSERQHETKLFINLSALIHNVNHYRSLLPPQVKLMGMVKAHSYGSGTYEVANELQKSGVDYLAVVYVDEGVQLRQKGVSLPVMVVNPEPAQLSQAMEYKLEPAIYSQRLLEEVIAFSKQQNEKVPVHIEVDTGMHRLGFSPQEWDALIEQLKQHRNLQVTSVYTHLGASDDAQLDAFTQTQFALFDSLRKKLSGAIEENILFHALNSSGISRFPEHHYDMVRLGIGMYGLDEYPPSDHALQNVYTLKTVISQLRQVKANESVGYSGRGKENTERTIAVVAIGYADGISRKLGNGNYSFTIAGKKAKTVGNICMDMCMLDVTHIPCKEGDEVLVFDSKESIREMSAALETIPYEIISGVSQRVKRVYIKE